MYKIWPVIYPLHNYEERFTNNKQNFKGFMDLMMGEKNITECNTYDKLLDFYMPEVPKVI